MDKISRDNIFQVLCRTNEYRFKAAGHLEIMRGAMLELADLMTGGKLEVSREELFCNVCEILIFDGISPITGVRDVAGEVSDAYFKLAKDIT